MELVGALHAAEAHVAGEALVRIRAVVKGARRAFFFPEKVTVCTLPIEIAVVSIDGVTLANNDRVFSSFNFFALYYLKVDCSS